MTRLAGDMAAEAIPCPPNIAPAGIRRRQRFGFPVAAAGAALIFRLPWIARAAVFVPAALSATGYLQARRNTCVLRAREGTIEHDDFSTEPAPAADVVVSRQVSKTITRDALLVGVAAGALAAATALVR
jgi:hypothetical protein